MAARPLDCTRNVLPHFSLAHIFTGGGSHFPHSGHRSRAIGPVYDVQRIGDPTLAVQLYVAMVDNLELSSAIASWPFPKGSVAPLDPSKWSTINLLAAGSIEPAAPGATDNTTPANTLRGTPGLKVAVSN